MMVDKIVVVILFVAVIVVICLTPYACTSPVDAQRVLEENGYTQVKTTGYKWFACGEDPFSTGFEAVNAQGKKVTGTVCGGFLKNDTIRFD